MSRRKNKKYEFPIDCKHRNFFGCKGPKRCLGCYYHPVKDIATGPYWDGEEGMGIWFYDDPEHVEKQLQRLEDIRTGRVRFPNGYRAKIRYAREEEPEEIY